MSTPARMLAISYWALQWLCPELPFLRFSTIPTNGAKIIALLIFSRDCPCCLTVLKQPQHTLHTTSSQLSQYPAKVQSFYLKLLYKPSTKQTDAMRSPHPKLCIPIKEERICTRCGVVQHEYHQLTKSDQVDFRPFQERLWQLLREELQYPFQIAR